MKFSTLEGNIGFILIKLFQCLPIERKIVFVSFYGNYISDSPKEIFLNLKKSNNNYRYVWLVKDATKKIEGARSVKIKSIAALYHMATAKAWVDNCRKREWVTKRKGQFYLQTWHGGIGMKKSEGQVEEKLERKYIQCAKNDSSMIDVLLSGSKWCTELYSNWFWYDGPVLETGCPRSDIFYMKEEWDSIKKRIYQELGIPQRKKLILYAPTFRQNYQIEKDKFHIDANEAAKTRWGGEWVTAVRLHPNVCNKWDILDYDETTVNASNYENMNELIIACDILVTDYSSCMFDGLEAGKKVILYMPDYEDYKNSRDFCWNIEELPFPAARGENELRDKILSFDESTYEKKRTEFMHRCCFVNSSTSTEKAVSYLLEKLNCNSSL